MRRIPMPSLVALTLFCGCAHSNQITWQIGNADDMRSALLQHVPSGTTAEEAKKFMATEGFTCKMKTDGVFYERRAFNDAGKKHEGIDFIQCTRVQSAGDAWVSRRWNVALVLANDRVTDVLVACHLDGP